MAESENYYLILDLDPTVSNQADIDKCIQEKQREWSNAAATGVGAKASKAKHYMSLLPKIRQVMSNQASRTAQAAAARKLLEKKMAATDADLDRHIASICANGHFTADQLKRLQNFFKGSHDAAEVERRLAKRCRRKDPSPKPSPPDLETIERTDQDKLRQNLAIVSHRDLYAFLGADRKTPAATLHAEADRINREIIKRNQNTSKANAEKELCGLAMKLFNSDAGKQRYDNTLSLAVMESMRSVIQASVSNKRITAKALDHLVREAAKQGMDRTRARDFILNEAEKQGWLVDSEGQGTTNVPQCSICMTIAERADQPNCGSCGHPFQIPCGKCGKLVAVANEACPHCGASMADAALMLNLLRQTERAMSTGDWPAVAECLARVEATWPNWPPATALKGRLDAHQDSLDRARAAVRALTEEHRLYAARDAIDRERSRLGEGFGVTLRKQLSVCIQRAEQQFQAGEQAKRDGRAEEAYERFEDAVKIAADHPHAARELSQMPPPAPSALQVTPATGGGFALTWPPVQANGRISYCVVANGKRPPRDIADGTPLAETAETTLTDTEAPVGLPWYYAVFSRRAGIASDSAVRSGPHLITVEVEDLNIIPGDGRVSLSWRRPTGCIGVEVYRSLTLPPAQAGTGEMLQVVGDACIDANVSNGQAYSYLVTALFGDPSKPGRRIRSSGIRHTMTPSPPPPPVTDLRAERIGDKVKLQWTPPDRGTVHLICCPTRPNLTCGEIVDLQSLTKMGTSIPVPNQSQTNFSPKTPITYVIPFTIVDEMATAGTGVDIIYLDPVTDLSSKALGNTMVLRWNWPRNADRVVLSYRHDCFPMDAEDRGVKRTIITRSEYQREGCHKLYNLKNLPHFLAVFVAAGPDGPYSPPTQRIEIMGQKHIVRYRIKRHKRFLLGAITDVQLVLEGKVGFNLPEMVLIGKPHHWPSTPNDGHVLLNLPTRELRSNDERIPVPRGHWGHNLFVRLFFKHSKDAENIRLLNDKAEELRL